MSCVEPNGGRRGGPAALARSASILGWFVLSVVGGLILPSAAPAQTLRVAVPGNGMGSLDPHRATASLDVNVVNWLFNGLVRIRPGQINPQLIEPDLAESWTTSPDGREWIFKLRDDVACHGDGGALTADDVVFSLKRAAAKETSSFFADYASLAGVQALDARNVKITLRQADPNLLGLLVPYHGGNIVCRKALERLGEAFARAPVGTGPFRVASFEPGQFLRLEAHGRYFRGAPRIREILFRYVGSDAALDLAFRNGEVDLVNGRSDESWMRRVAGMTNVTAALLGPMELHSLHLNASRPPLDDRRVRMAIAHAIDREALVQFRGRSIARAAQSVVPSGYLGSTATSLPRHDLAEAKRLLAEAGYPAGIKLRAIQTGLSTALAPMTVIQSQLRAAGIELELEIVDHPSFHALIRKDLSQLVYYGAARFPVAGHYLTQFFESASTVGRPGAITNFSHCSASDPEIAAARQQLSAEMQAALWGKAQQKIVEAVCAIPLFEIGQPWAWTKRLSFAYPLSGSLGLSPPIDETTSLVD